MIFFRLKHLAVILLVLLSVVTAMGNSKPSKGSLYMRTDGNCLSLRDNKQLKMECCEYDDPKSPQLISVTKIDDDLGVYHSANFSKIICHNAKRSRFQIISRRKLQKMAKIRHPLNKFGRRGMSNDLIPQEESFLKTNKKGYMNCLLSEQMEGGWMYLNAKQLSSKNSKKTIHVAAKGKRILKTSRPIVKHRSTQFLKCSVGHSCFRDQSKKNLSNICRAK